jgi:hypothetical protein
MVVVPIEEEELRAMGSGSIFRFSAISRLNLRATANYFYHLLPFLVTTGQDTQVQNFHNYLCIYHNKC